jgi:DMSO reductase family type II enzyme heme b subunit
MKQRISLIAAPTAIQPGGYIADAYEDATKAHTPEAVLSVQKTLAGWRVHIVWDCASPVQDIKTDTNLFADGAALLVPVNPDTPMMSMGAAGLPVEGFLWRADWKEPLKIGAEGFGTVQRAPAPSGWKTTAIWDSNTWTVLFEIPHWPALDSQKRLGVAIWQGSARERAGLKSVTPDWIAVEG